MQGQWNHGHGYYRCKFVEDYPDTTHPHPKSIYVQQDAIVPGLDRWLASLFDDDHLDETCATLAGESTPDPDAEAHAARLHTAIADCDRKIHNYRRLLDNDDSITLAVQWIAETQRQRHSLARQLSHHTETSDQLTTDQVKALVAAFHDMITVLADADPHDKTELYEQLGVTLTYDPTGTITVKAEPRGVTVRVGGPIRTIPYRTLASHIDGRGPTPIPLAIRHHDVRA